MDPAAIFSYARPLIELLARGGPVVAILLFMSIVAVTIAIAKMIQFSALGIARSEHAERSICLLYTSPSPRDRQKSRMPSSA